MGFNSGVFSGPNGSLRLFTLILGAIVVGLTADSYYDIVQNERFFFWTAVILLIVSAILAVAAFLGIYEEAVFVRKADGTYHIIGGIVLLIGGILMLISVVDHKNNETTGRFIERIAAGAIGIINALIYCSLGYHSCRGGTVA